MKFQIGAMSIGDILDRGIKLLTSRLLTFYVVNLIVSVPVFLVQLAFPATSGGGLEVDQRGQIAPSQLGQMIVGVYGVLFLNFILQPIGTAATLHVISQEFVDRHVGIGDALRFAFRRFGRLLWASFLVSLMSMAGMFACCVPGFLFMVWYIFVAQVVVVEGFRGGNALARSKSLTSGFRWRILGVGVLIWILYAANGAVASMIAIGLPSATPVRTENTVVMVTHYRNYIINLTFNHIGQILVQTFAAICWTLFYFDIRIRKEGLDLELAAQQQASGPGEQPQKPNVDMSGLE